MIFESLNQAATDGELILVDGGMCHFHKRRDGSITIREIIVVPALRRRGVARRIVELLLCSATFLTARCPEDLPSNCFWYAMGFVCSRQEKVKKTGRVINVWTKCNETAATPRLVPGRKPEVSGAGS